MNNLLMKKIIINKLLSKWIINIKILSLILIMINSNYKN